LWNALSASAPFLACGVIKIAYDVSLFALFRGVKPPEERSGPRPSAERPEAPGDALAR
jgi:hypothetical protein